MAGRPNNRLATGPLLDGAWLFLLALAALGEEFLRLRDVGRLDLAKEDGERIFPSKRARDGHLTTVTKQFEKVRKEAGLPNDLVLYCARHGFGTEMYRATKNLFAVMNVMGHTTVSTTMKYQHQNIDEVAEVASHRVQ